MSKTRDTVGTRSTRRHARKTSENEDPNSDLARVSRRLSRLSLIENSQSEDSDSEPQTKQTHQQLKHSSSRHSGRVHHKSQPLSSQKSTSSTNNESRPHGPTRLSRPACTSYRTNISPSINIDVVFPPFECIQYTHLSRHFIIDIPRSKHLLKWMKLVLQHIALCDLVSEDINELEWFVLLFPSLLLIVSDPNIAACDEELLQLAQKVIDMFREYMVALLQQTEKIEINELLMCIELYDSFQVHLAPNENDAIENRPDDASSHSIRRDTSSVSDEIESKSRDDATESMHANAQIIKTAFLRLNNVLEGLESLDQFIDLSLNRQGSICVKLLPRFRNCTVKKHNLSKLRNAFINGVAIYTHLSRLHRILFFSEKMESQLGENGGHNVLLSKRSILIVKNVLLKTFSEEYLVAIRQLMPTMIEASDNMKMDFCFYRYKTLCMCTHTPTTIASTFAGYIGYVGKVSKNLKTTKKPEDDTKKQTETHSKTLRRGGITQKYMEETESASRGPLPRRGSRLKTKTKMKASRQEEVTGLERSKSKSTEMDESDQKYVKATEDEMADNMESKVDDLEFGHDLDMFGYLSRAIDRDVKKFCELVGKVLKSNTRGSKLNFVRKMSKRDSEPLRLLDNIAYVTVCQQLMSCSLDYCQPQQKLKWERELKRIDVNREQIKRCICLLAQNSLCFSDSIDTLHNVFQDEFLTSSKHGRLTWVLHLMAGVFLCFWKKQSQ